LLKKSNVEHLWSVNGKVVGRLSGRMDSENIARSEILVVAEADGKSIVLDLKEITLSDRDDIAYLARASG
jgi:hypothetical protein